MFYTVAGTVFGTVFGAVLSTVLGTVLGTVLDTVPETRGSIFVAQSPSPFLSPFSHLDRIRPVTTIP